MMGIGFPELMIILVIIMIIFGAGKLPEIGSAFGRSIKNFKSSMKEAEAEELETDTSSETVATESPESPESSEGASENQGAEAKDGSSTAVKKKAAKKEEDLIDEAALEIKENRIGTIRTPHDGLVQ